MTDHNKEFWDRLDGVMAGMLAVKGEKLAAMSPNLRRRQGW